MKHGSLFSGGCDGFSLAAEWAGWQTIFQVEKNEHRRKILAKNFPEATRYSDICKFNAKPYRGAIDVISGGFPCQPFSVAGKQKGTADDRFLWPEMLRVIKEIRPPWVVGENVAAITKMALDQVLSDLEAIGYTTEAYIIPACAVNAPHRRNRVWIIAHTNHAKAPRHETKNINTERENSNATDTNQPSAKHKVQTGRDMFASISTPNLQSPEQKPPGNTRAGGAGFADNNIHASNPNESGLQRRKQQTETGSKQSRQFRPGNSQSIANTGTRHPQPWDDTTQRGSKRPATGRNPKKSGINGGCGDDGGAETAGYKENRNDAWDQNWLEVATELCGVDDGIPHRVDRIASCGDAIVPQIAYEIFEAINQYMQNETN